MVRLKLPYPVSANRYWRIWRNKAVRSAEATAKGFKGHLTCPTVDKWWYLNRRTVCESGKFQTASEEAVAKRIEWFERDK